MQKQLDTASGLNYIKLFCKHFSQRDHGLWETGKHSRVHGAMLPSLVFSDKLRLLGGNMLKLSSSIANIFQSIWTLFPLLPDRDCPFVIPSVYQSPGPNFPNPDGGSNGLKSQIWGWASKYQCLKQVKLPNTMVFHIQILFRQHV